MKSIIEFRDGHFETVQDGAPTVSGEESTILFIDAQNGCLTDDIPLSTILRVTFYPELDV